MAHIEKEEKSYTLDGSSTVEILEMIIAFLIANFLVQENILLN